MIFQNQIKLPIKVSLKKPQIKVKNFFWFFFILQKYELFFNYRMEPSTNYNKTMFIWKNNKKQKNLMIKEKCINNFSINKFIKN